MSTVLHINTVCATGSTGGIAESLGRYAMDRGWQAATAYGRGNGAQRSLHETYRIDSKLNYVLNSARAHLFDNDGFVARRPTLRLIRYMQRLRPDVVHLHNLHGKYLHTGMLFRYLAETDIPVVWTLHDCWPLTGHCTHFDFVKCDRWQTGCHHCPQKAEYPECWLLDRSSSNYARKRDTFLLPRRLTLVPVSEWLAEQVGRSFLAGTPVRCIRNGVDTTLFRPRGNGEQLRRRIGAGNRRMAVAVAAVWKERKGTRDYIELARRMPDDCVLVMVGLTPRQIAQMPQNIIALPRTDGPEELAEIYSAADVVLNLSYEESFGLTTVEGLACGTPGVVYNATASPELIDRHTGRVVTAGNVDEALHAALRVMRSPHYTAEACRERALHLFEAEDRKAEYLELYEAAIGTKQQTPSSYAQSTPSITR